MKSTIGSGLLASLVVVGLAGVACTSSSGGSGGGYGYDYGGSNGYGGSTTGSGGATGSGGTTGSGGATGDANAEGAGCVDLTVLNYLNWCSVSIAGAAPSTGASQTACVQPGAVSLSATPLTGFQLGLAPWHRTDGDHGTGELGTVTGNASTATVTVSGAQCVWVCCEFTGGGGCPTANQCP